MKLLVLDCDGVISKGEAQPIDPHLLGRLAALNRRARRGEATPAVTFNTGRPSPYIEAVMQAIDGWLPALYENGAGLYFPQAYRFETTPLLGKDQAAALDQVIAQVERAIVQTGRAYWQPGKTICHSLFAHHPLTIADLVDEAAEIAARISDRIVVEPAKLALNIYPLGINKGSGIKWLAERTAIPPHEMAGVGDTAGDIDFLRLVGSAACPANATEPVKAMVDYISPLPDAAGLGDILDQWGLPVNE